MGAGSSSQSERPSEPVRMSVDESGNVTFSPLPAKFNSASNATSHSTSETSSDSIKKAEVVPPIHKAQDITTPVETVYSEKDVPVSELPSTDYPSTPAAAKLNMRGDEVHSKKTEADESTLSPARKRLTLESTNDVFKPLEEQLLKCYADNKSQPLRCSEQVREYRDFVTKHRKNLMSSVAFITIVFTIMLLHVGSVQSFGSMSVDLGSEWMKVGLVAPSVQMDIVLNPQSQRKTSMAVSFNNGERFVGDAAADIASKYPEKTFTHFLDLIAKPIDHESVRIYQQRFPYIKITSHPNSTNAILLHHPEGMSFTPLELTAIMLQHAHEQVLERLNNLEPVNDVVLTVPAYFNISERHLIQKAAQLIGLNVLQLINSNSAFALSYGIFRHKEYETNKTTIMFYDQGASSSSATIAQYFLTDLLTQEGEKKNETIPTVAITAVAYDRYLGGFEMQLRLRNFLAEAFSKQSGIKLEKILSRGKSSAKLLKEAGRVKKVLSANTDYVVRIENVMDDKDLRVAMSRQKYEDLCNDLLTTRTTKVIDDLFESTNITIQDIEKVIIAGGNTRTPKIQKVIQDHLKLDQLGKQINADEGAALAALYQAASLGRGFRVKKFLFQDIGDATQDLTGSEVNSTTTEENDSLDNNTYELQNVTIFSDEDLEQMRLKLVDLKQQDLLRLQRLSLKNSLESLLGDIKSRLDYDETLKQRSDDIKKVVSETSAWLDEGSHEIENVTLLMDKLTILRLTILPIPEPEPEPVILPSNSSDSSSNDTILETLVTSIISNETTTPVQVSTGTNQSTEATADPSKSESNTGSVHTEL